jgi:PST family polysaccharide transporter
MIYILFFQMFLEQGLMAALIQKRNIEFGHLNSVFWMNLILSISLVGISILLSRWWAKLYNITELPDIIAALSITMPIQSLAIVQTALLQREMDFKSLALRSYVGVVSGGTVGIVMALTGFGIWALVGQQVIRESTSLAALWKFSPWRPRFSFSWKHLRDLLGFSVSNFIGQLAVFANAQAGPILLGTLFGPVAVGLYGLAERFMNTVLSSVTGAIRSVSLPEFSRFQDKSEELRNSVISCIKLSSTITLPVLAGLAAVSAPLMAMLGPKWIPASNVLKILCLLGMTQIFIFFTGPLLQALSMTRLLAALEWGRTILTIGILVLATSFVRDSTVSRQVMSIAIANTLTGAFIITPVFLYILIRLCKISFLKLVTTLIPSIMAAVSVICAVILLDASQWFATSRFINVLIAEVFVGGFAGIVVLLTLDLQLRSSIAGMFQKYFGKMEC